MPGSAFFRNLGLFVIDDFLRPEACTQLCSEMVRSTSDAGTVVRPGEARHLDVSARKVLCANIPKDSWFPVREQLRSIRPSLEQHFNVALHQKCHGPDFLIYKEGGFYVPHRDASFEAPEGISERRVSVVVFLNGRSQEPTLNAFGGGALTFHGLMDEPGWEKCAFDLEPAPGLLVAFRSDTLHEVQPVTFGERYTTATWFTAERVAGPVAIKSANSVP